MNAIISPLVIAFSLYAGYSWAVGYQSGRSVWVSWTRRSVFQYQVENHLIGGTLEVFDEGKNLIVTEQIQRSKNTVDFLSLSPGQYAIQVKKGDEVFNFTYVKAA